MTTRLSHSVEELRQQAKRLRNRLAHEGAPVSHGRALELIAAQYGFKDWNTLYAWAGNTPPAPAFAVGQRIAGTYLGQEFLGEIIGLNRLSHTGKYRVTIQFDDPVDVVTFDSFSAFRHRVSAVVDETGISAEKTSNGEPHMQLALDHA